MASKASQHDIIISIHPQHLANIISRVKNHEFRNYLLPPSTKRLLIYETSPASAIRYVATISHGKQPGEICDSTGLRNDEFDRGDLEGRVKYGYEIRKLEEFPKPYSLDDLKRNGWLNGAPQKYCFVKPAMDDVLKSVPLRLIFDTLPAATSPAAEALLPTAYTRVQRSMREESRSVAGIQKTKPPQSRGRGRQALLEQWLRCGPSA
ncbi:hypothetical protein H634G_11175 [Metarhizium anisopliae BRIP 53293]|uniref:ASCH domain-containing protein n=1 Tax=Metarhizium anisopliae BRIP 53293 TaxID=1291518 RepID=A0A0D9NHY8_METAN|nr:hypothetical protein H634G_11175 [Metarhizium anisopliae BRIP 53293]KJK86216.1 hypothetical protein H633G_09937 [Metarhizium anisopliae BRIP 53284]